MNKAHVVERYKALLVKLNEDAPDVILAGDAALVVLGAQESTEEIVVGLRPPMFAYLAGGKDTLPHPERFELEPGLFITAQEDNVGVVYANGTWVISPSELLRWKRFCTRLGTLELHTEERLCQEAFLQTLVKERRYTARVI